MKLRHQACALTALVLAGAPLAFAGDTASAAQSASLDCAPHQFVVYFPEREATLTDAAHAALAANVAALEPCDVGHVAVVAFPDAQAGRAGDLSSARAEEVAQALRAHGLQAEPASVRAAASAPSAPMTRRAVVTLTPLGRAV